jgi:HSP20 family molecular chaperone IbpA
VVADFSNGVLKVTVPKLVEQKAKAKKIRVNAL